MKIENPEIIFADDDYDDRIFFRETVKKVIPGARLHEFLDGKQVMNHLAGLDALPHMIFLDINMPFKTGIQCLKEIRGNERFCHIPVIMFTTSDSQFDIDNSFDCGANLYIHKPYSYTQGIKLLTEFFTELDFDKLREVSREKFYMASDLI